MDWQLQKPFQVRKHIRPFLVLLFTEAALSTGFEIQYSDEYGLKNRAGFSYEGWLPPKLSLEFYYAVCRCGFQYFRWCFYVLNDVRQNVAVVLLFLYSIFPNLDAIIRVSMLLCESSMLLFVFVCCYAKPRCYYSCPYAVLQNLDAIIRVSNYVRLNPGLQRARPLWSGASDKLIMPKKIYATLRGCEEIVLEHLEQLASPNWDSDSQDMVSEMVQNSQSLYSFTFNALFIIHEYIYSHSTTKF